MDKVGSILSVLLLYAIIAAACVGACVWWVADWVARRAGGERSGRGEREGVK